MKREKLSQLISEVLESERRAATPVTFDTLEVNFLERTVTIRGHTIKVESPIVSIPLLSTDQFVIPRNGDVL